MKLRFLLIFLSLYSLNQGYATHIVGGNVTYRYLGSNRYELTFKVYRDCNSTTKFDGDPTNTGPGSNQFFYTVFDNSTQNDVITGSLSIKTKGRVSSVITNKCVDTNLACVEQATYMDTITVPDATKWYSIVHQRCCRNNSIVNIQPTTGGGGGGTSFPGMSIFTNIPPTSTYGNNSAVFKQFPPLFLCVDRQVNFDHSATDSDGDLLKYYLVTPLDGGSSGSPTVPVATFNQSQVSWNPPFNLSNIMGGSPILNLDENTGLLSCKPDAVGRYVVSIMVKEFRSGVCIDSSIRDFQFNVVQCDLPNPYLPYTPGTYDPITGIGEYELNCKSNTIKFNNASTGSSSYLWNFGDPSSGILDTSSLTNPSHTYNSSGTYLVTLVGYVIGVQNKLCEDTIKRKVRIFPTFKTNFSFPTTSPVICKGKDVQFTDITQATSGIVNEWQWDFGDGGVSSIQHPKHSYSSSTNFNVKLISKSNLGCIDTMTLPLNVNPTAMIKADPVQSCLNQSFNLVCNITPPSNATISSMQWRMPNGNKSGNCNISYTPTSLGNLSFNLWAMTSQGCIDSLDVPVQVNALPTISTPPDTFICYNKNVQLDATGGLTYTWTPTTYLSNPNISNPIASPVYPNPITYTVKGTDANGCSNFDLMTISFRTKPFISAGLDTSVCMAGANFRDKVDLNGQGAFPNVWWTPATGLNNPNIPNPTCQLTKNTEYIFHGTDAFGCVIEDSVKVYVLDPALDLIPKTDTNKCVYDRIVVNPLDQGDITAYTWTPVSFVSNPNIRNPWFSNPVSTTYKLSVQNYCYIKSDTIRITAIPRPDIQMKDKDSICVGETYQYALNTAYTYQWAPNPTLSNRTISNPTTTPKLTNSYFVTATDNFGCTNSDNMELLVNYPPFINVQGLENYLCLGDSMHIKAITNNANAWIRWAPGVFISDTTTHSTSVFPPNNQKYYVRAYRAWNCFSTDSFTIKVQKPVISSVQTPVHVCKGSAIDLYSSGGKYYLWLDKYNIQDTHVSNPQVFPDTSHIYKVKIFNDCFSDTKDIEVIVDTLPKVTVNHDTLIYRGSNLDLTATSNSYYAEWQPTNLIKQFYTDRKINVEPNDSTRYTVKVKDGNGCIGYNSVYVKVFGKNVLLIPTGFSPNGDGVNDVFRVSKHLNVKVLNYFEIYNRWGEKVFSTKDINKGWDGTINESPTEVGAYSWSIQVTNYEGQKITKSGQIDLLR